MGAGAIFDNMSLWHPTMSPHITPSLNDPVDFYTSLQR